MSDKLYTYPLDKLLKWILEEEKQGKIFGYYKELFFTPKNTDRFKMQRYGKLLDTPLGVAAGPHTQLSQNIVLSWLFGARYIELKTVQVLDSIEVAKPCIDMADEGYNCEWSQELSIEESFDQYLDAWIILHILKDKFGYELGAFFNISVGYDLKGIKSEKVSNFLSRMLDASEELSDKINLISTFYPRVKDIDIPSQISDNVTLSTMHGCPPDEIESIATYLMEYWKFHTAVKLNPTLPGKDIVRNILNDKLGYSITIPDMAFEHDISFKDAKRIIHNLLQVANENHVEFGIKLTNTLESLNGTEQLPDNQEMVYMSGRALHPISINTAALLQKEFNGELDISFSGGADAFNFADIVASNLKPVTVCSDLLKPGGYSRLTQYLDNLDNEILNAGASGIDDFIRTKGESDNIIPAGLNTLNNYSHLALESPRYKQSFIKDKSIKTTRKLDRLDCIHPPCVESCAISQNVPEYLYHAANADFDKSLMAILEDNALPNITGQVCDHLCQTKCTRMNIDNSIQIREVKRFAAEYQKTESKKTRRTKEHEYRVAVIGGGPSGLSAAYFLVLAGIKVDVYESGSQGGGMAHTTIPVFRISDESLNKDIDRLKSLGVKFHFNHKVDKSDFEQFKNNYNKIFIAVGAQIGKALNIPGEDSDKVIDQITFLEFAKDNHSFDIGKNIAVIGGGNSAMDAARTAKRLAAKNKGKVTVVYRRTINEMPADKHEVEALLEEGISVFELTAPVSIGKNSDGLELNCVKMQLGDADNSGRRRPVPVSDSEFTLNFDYIITAIGQDVELDFLPDSSIDFNPKTKETKLENVLAGGDFVRGADSLINAMADGKDAAQRIIEEFNSTVTVKEYVNHKTSLLDYQSKLSKRIYGHDLPVLPVDLRDSFNLVNPLPDEKLIVDESTRCLFCDEVCNICVSVCPNIANYYYEIDPVSIKYPVIRFNENGYDVLAYKYFEIKQKYQIFNINDFCNECGDCGTFCPTSGAPYKIKPKFSLSKKSFDESNESYLIEGDSLIYKNDRLWQSIKLINGIVQYEGNNFSAEFKKDFTLINIVKKGNSDIQPDVERMVELSVYLQYLKGSFISTDY